MTDNFTISTTLPVMEAFYTLQGEGRHSGSAAYFIRLGGCDVGCVWCDVKDSWDATIHPQLTVERLVALAEARQSFFSAAELTQLPAGVPEVTGEKPIVVITGGEPLMHDLGALTTSLHRAGFVVHVETSAAHSMRGNFDWICVSPKKFKAPLPEILPMAQELKVVIYNKSDFDWAEQFAARVAATCQLYLQPEWDRREQMLPLIIDYVKANPQWKLSLQSHKYINVP